MSYGKVIIFLFLLITFLIFACGEKEQEEKIIRPVRYKQIYLQGADRLRIFPGSARAGFESKLSFKVAGTIRYVNVQVGDKVRKGQLLAQLDQIDYKLRVQEAEAALRQVESLELNAKNNYDRVRQLYENRNASKSELDAARTTHESAIASVERLNSTLELARLQLNYTTITAPQEGVIASCNVEVNENIKSGDQVFILSSEGRKEVEISIPEVLISNIKRGNQVTVTFDAVKETSFKGTVSEVGVTTGRFSTTYPVVIQIDNPTGEIRSGMAAEVAFNFKGDESISSLIIPLSSIGDDENGRYVYIAIPEDDGLGIVKKQYVVLGELTGQGQEVREGLSDGDLIVTAGVTRIIDGQKVRLLGL
ncbi:efflux RND transporter periplasmic adaptor subunit [Bacteroidota bacterium]